MLLFTTILIIILIIFFIDFLIRKKKKKLGLVIEEDHSKLKKSILRFKIIAILTGILSIFSLLFLVPTDLYFKIVYGGVNIYETTFEEYKGSGKLYYKDSQEEVNGNIYTAFQNIGNVSNGELNGEITFYKRNYKSNIFNFLFNKEKNNKATYINGLIEGKYLEWHYNGTLKVRCHYKNGKMNGIYEEWDSNGRISSRGNFIDGDGRNKATYSKIPRNGRDGMWEHWHYNGQKSQIGFWLNGKANGNFTFWNMNGTITRVEHYENGNYKWQDNYDDNGVYMNRTR